MAISTTSSTPHNFQELRRTFTPKFDTKLPIERDENRDISGTAALIFQGFTMRNIVNSESGESFSKRALVFACLGLDGKFKNIPVLVNESLIHKAFEAMNLELPTIERDNPLAAIPGMEGFNGTYDIDVAELYNVVYPMRGKLFTGVMSRKQSKRGVYYFELNLETLKPTVINGEHKALQKPEQTKPEVTDFDWND